MGAHYGFGKTVNKGLVLAYDTGDILNSYRGEPTENLITLGGTDPEVERSGTSYPYYSTNITSLVQSRWSTSNNLITMSFEGKRDYVDGGTGGGNDGYPRMYVYFSDWSWSRSFGTGAYDWEYVANTGAMPDPTGKSVYFAIYHMNAGNRGRSYSRKHQVELKPHATPFVNGTRSATQGLLDLTGNSAIDLTNTSYDGNAQLEFDGTDDKIDIPTNFGVLDAYTFEYVAYANSTHNMPVSSRTSTAFYKYGAYSWRYTHGGVADEFYHTTGNEVGWAHYAITYDGTTITVWENGVSKGTRASTGTADFSSGIRIGSWASSASYTWDGTIPVMKMYNRALTAAEVAQNYNHYKSRFGI